jgi:hypothetical protein
MGARKGVYTDLEYFSYQLLEISRVPVSEYAKHPIWWDGLRRDFQRLSPERINEIVLATVVDIENTKTESELRTCLNTFIGI